MPLREPHLAESLNRLFALWGFVDDSTFITKPGHVGLVYRLGGVDYEGLDDTQRAQHVRRFEDALRLLDPAYCIYQYVLKRHSLTLAGRPLYSTDLYLAVVYEDIATQRSWRETWRPTDTLTLLAGDLDRALAHLHAAARDLELRLVELRPTRLAKGDAFRFFRQLVNGGEDAGVTLQHDTDLDYFIADAMLARHRDHLIVGDSRVKVMTMKEAPSATYAAMLDELYAIPGEFIACLEWQRIPIERARRDLRSRRRWHHNTRMRLSLATAQTGSADRLVDDSKLALVAQLGNALTDIEVNGHFFGDCSLTVVTSGPEADRVAAHAARLLAAHDGSFVSQTYNALNAWLSIVPGNRQFNRRRLPLLETNAGDLSFLFSVADGDALDAAGRAPLIVLPTQQHTAYRYHLHVEDVGHTLVLGATGSGKTFLLNEWASRAQQYAPRTVIFDLGHGYRALAHRLGGRYLTCGLDAGVAINPFALSPTPENLHFLDAFVRCLIEGRESNSYRIPELLDRELFEAIAHLSVLPPSSRRLGTLAYMLPLPLTERLEKWITDGRYGRLFDHDTDTLSLGSFQVFDFTNLREYPELLEPLLVYILHRVTAALTPDTLTLCIMDEAWRFIQHPTLRTYVESALKTWRKQNAAMLLATQAIEDFASTPLLRTVVESCPTTLLLANPKLNPDTYRDLFKLNDVELDLLLNLRPKGQFLLKRQGLAKVLDLMVDHPPAAPAAHKEPAYA